MSGQKLHTTEEWVKILQEQADFTEEYRHNLYRRVNIQTKRNILDVGCGPGIVTVDIAALTTGHVTGIDVDDKKLAIAKTIVSDDICLLMADVLELPFKNNTFDLVVFSVVLPYVKDQQKAVNEMVRVTEENGIILATLEPDYAGELSYPEDGAHLPRLEYMKKMGVDITTGRKLKFLFRKAGLRAEIGVCDSSLHFINRDPEENVKEFLKNYSSNKEFYAKLGWTEQQIEEHLNKMMEIIKNDLGFRFTPAFYAIGKKQK
jgi:ubiquinone/menaquinone biosynthesis C-methylase UbiE